jgi:hypothetical protein
MRVLLIVCCASLAAWWYLGGGMHVVDSPLATSVATHVARAV